MKLDGKSEQSPTANPLIKFLIFKVLSTEKNPSVFSNPEFIERGESAEIEFEPQQLFYLESFEQCQGLGRIAVMDSNQLVMLGKVMSVQYKKPKK